MPDEDLVKRKILFAYISCSNQKPGNEGTRKTIIIKRTDCSSLNAEF